MNTTVVGQIEEYDVLYVIEKDLIFCKNTAIPFEKIKSLIKSSIDRESLKSDLVYTRRGSTITLGCLITDIGNCHQIIKTVNNIKRLIK